MNKLKMMVITPLVSNQNLPKTFTSTSAPVAASWVKFDRNARYNILSSNHPTPLYNVNNTLLSSTL